IPRGQGAGTQGGHQESPDGSENRGRRRQYLRIRNPLPCARPADSTRGPGQARRNRSNRPLHAHRASRCDRRTRHHIPQLPRFRRPPWHLRRSIAGLRTRRRTLLSLPDSDKKCRRRTAGELLLPAMPEIGVIGKEESTMPPLQGRLRRAVLLLIAVVAAAAPSFSIAAPPSPDWSAVNKEALDYFRTYLRFDTTNPPDNTAQAIGFLKGILDREGIETATFESKPGAMSLVARLPGPPGRKPFLLLSHVDVVPAVASDWSHPPFSADLADGYVWGRGAIDNKAHGIMALMTMLELKRNHVPLRRGVVMMVNADEEAGGANGAQWMAANHWKAFDPAFAVNEGGIAIPDPFGGRGNVFEVSVAEKRVLWLKVTAHGHSGHGSIPRPDNP